MKENVVLGTGLQAREAASLAQVASRYRSRILLEHGSRLVNVKSMMGMISLGLTSGERVTLIAEGEDEQRALEAVARLLRA